MRDMLLTLVCRLQDATPPHKKANRFTCSRDSTGYTSVREPNLSEMGIGLTAAHTHALKARSRKDSRETAIIIIKTVCFGSPDHLRKSVP